MLDPDPQRLQAQPGDQGGVGDEVGRRQDRVDQPGRGQQRRVGELGREPDRRRRRCRSSHRYRRSNWRSSSAASRSAAGTVMPHSRSDSRPSSIASAKRLRWVRLRTCTAVASARSSAVGHSRSIVRYSSSASSRRPRLNRAAWRPVRTSTSVAVVSRVDQPQRGRQQRVHQRVVADQRRLVGGAPQQPHHLAPLRRVVDRVDHRQVLLGRDREQLRHPGQPPRQGQLQGASPRRVQPAQDRLADPVVAEPHRRHARRAPSPAGPRRGRAPAAVPPRAAGSPVAACSRLSSARPPRHAIASSSCRDAAGMASTRAASSPATSDWPRCARTAASSHRHPPAVAVSSAVAAQRVEQLHGLVRIAARVRLDHLDQAAPRRPGPRAASRPPSRRGSARAG